MWSFPGVANTGTVAGPNTTSQLFSTRYSFMLVLFYFFTVCFRPPKKNIPPQVPSATSLCLLIALVFLTVRPAVSIPQRECVSLSYSCSLLQQQQQQPSIKRLLTAFGSAARRNPSLIAPPPTQSAASH